MKRAIVLLAMMWAGSASADPKVWLDDLLPLVDPPASVVVQPKSHGIDTFAGAAADRHDRLWQAIDVTALVASTAALACDWAQTRGVSQGSWMSRGTYTSGIKEYNPLLGAAPSPRALDVYFASAAVINAALWVALPKRYRAIIPGIVIAAESRTIYNNIPYTGMCGL